MLAASHHPGGHDDAQEPGLCRRLCLWPHANGSEAARGGQDKAQVPLARGMLAAGSTLRQISTCTLAYPMYFDWQIFRAGFVSNRADIPRHKRKIGDRPRAAVVAKDLE